MPSIRGRLNPYALAVIGLISCSMLMYEILLTRICALRLFFHFGFLIISNCLLGIGASGTLISICQDRWKERPRFWITFFSVLYPASLALTYVFLLKFHIPYNLNLWQLADLFRFSAYNLVAAVPFFFAGTVVGLVLTFNSERINTVYFSDLTGAGFGCLLCPLMLQRYGAGGCVVFLALLAVVAAIVAFPPERKRVVVAVGIIPMALGAWLVPELDHRFPVPGKDMLDFTDEMTIRIAKRPDYSKWGTNCRIDLIPLPEEGRFIFCRGRNVDGLPPIPEEKLILQDGCSITPIANFSDYPEGLQIIEHSMYSAALQLKDRPRVLVIGPGGGCELWAAKIHNASFVKGVELNQPILDIHRTVLPNYSKALLDDPRIQLICDEGRSALMRDSDTYDVIQMTFLSTYTAMASGAYVLAESYLYTQEAFQSMYSHLAPGGILQVIWTTGATETLRLFSNLHAVLQAEGVPDFDKCVMCMHSRHEIGILVKKGAFTGDEVSRMARFATQVGLDPLYLPNHSFGGLAETFIRTKDKAAFIRDCSTNISPVTDNKPYFFFFSRWPNPFNLGHYKWKANTAFPANPLFILFQLGLSATLSVALIVSPLAVFGRKGIRRAGFKRYLAYFAGLGFGFIAIEVVSMQKLTLFLGHPLYSITVTLFSLLIFTGLGSLLSARWFQPPDRRVWFVPLGLAVLLILFIFLSPQVVAACIRLPLAARIAITVGMLAPISLLLGVPFAYGIRVVNIQNPSLIPWAWAVNGCSTVVGAILTAALSMNFGFNAVLVASIVVYLAAFVVLEN